LIVRDYIIFKLMTTSAPYIGSMQKKQEEREHHRERESVREREREKEDMAGLAN